MTVGAMNGQARDLVLACEVAGLLHDLGKLRPEFAQESAREGAWRTPQPELGIRLAHGAILEPGRPYPPAGEAPWLALLRAHPGWAGVLRLPEGLAAPGTVQAEGLGMALRQHHASSQFPPGELSLLGDLYTFAADGRDSALDKGSAGAKSGGQGLGQGRIADSFGNEDTPYQPDRLTGLWEEAARIIQATLFKEGAWQRLTRTRRQFLQDIEPLFRQALGETRRPTNDVTLWHHAWSAASLFKAAVAEGLLRGGFQHLQDSAGLFDLGRLGQVRYRLLGIRWDWAELTRGALRPVVLTALAQRRAEAVAGIRRLIEQDYPLGNRVYEDDDGLVFVVPGFWEGTDAAGQARSALLFRERVVEVLLPEVLAAVGALGAGTPLRLAWSEPTLYLTDYPEVMGTARSGNGRERLAQAGEEELRILWQRAGAAGEQVQICPQCGLRPAGVRELELTESGLGGGEEGPQDLCATCADLASPAAFAERRRQAETLFGIEPRGFNLQEVRRQRAPGNSRMALISACIDPLSVASGQAFLTQLARPLADLSPPQCKTAAVQQRLGGWPPDPARAGDLLQGVLDNLGRGTLPDKEVQAMARSLVGDDHWLKETDGRAGGSPAAVALAVARDLFLREVVAADLGLVRHDGDRLLLFGQRRHASPARLARTWDDLRELWQGLLAELAGLTDGWLVPLSLDARGVRLLVAAADARTALEVIRTRLETRLARVRTGLVPHLSVLVFREKFPLYLALDAIRRMERRTAVLPTQDWTLRGRRLVQGELELQFATPQGPVTWCVPNDCAEADRPDFWYAHAACLSRPAGPGRLVHLRDLGHGEVIRLRSASFDLQVLEGSARRYQIRYDAQGRRPHYVLGEEGRASYLLERLADLLALPGRTGWNASQAKGILGRIVECYEKWVRDAPPSLRAKGSDAWRGHSAAILRRYLPGQPDVQASILEHLADGLLFDAFDWAGLVEKDPIGPVDRVTAHAARN